MALLAAPYRAGRSATSVHRRDPALPAIGVAIAVFLLAFRLIALEVAGGHAAAFDRAVLHALNPPGRGKTLAVVWGNIAAGDFSAMGSVSVLAFLVVQVCGLFLCLRRWREAALLFLASGGGLALTNGLKDLYERSRPPLSPEMAAGLNASFPSGHAMLSATVYLTLGVLIGYFAERRLVRVYALGTAVLLTALIGVSRIYLGVHWCTDVLGGWCVGAAWALLWWGAAILWEEVSRRRLSTGASRRDS